MNAALVGILKDWMNDHDRQKEKEKDRKYSESQRQAEWNHEDAKSERDRANRFSDTIKLDKERDSIADAALKEKFAGEADGLVTRYPGTTPEYWGKRSNWNPSQLDEAEKAHNDFAKSLPSARADNEVATLAASTPVRQAFASNPEEMAMLGNAMRTREISANQSADALARKSLVETEAELPGAGDLAREAQALKRSNVTYGGVDPAYAVKQPFITTFDPTTRRVTLTENPWKDRMEGGKSGYGGAAGLLGVGNLNGIAEQLGFEKTGLQFDEMGQPVKRVVNRPTVVAPVQTDVARPIGVLTPGPERQLEVIPAAYKGYADYINSDQNYYRTPQQQEQVDLVRKSTFEKMLEERRKQQAQQSYLRFP